MGLRNGGLFRSPSFQRIIITHPELWHVRPRLQTGRTHLRKSMVQKSFLCSTVTAAKAKALRQTRIAPG